jgi:hypothetical protein
LLFIIFSLGSVISILFIDKPAALWIHAVGLDKLSFLNNITETPQYWLSITYIMIILIFPTVQQTKSPNNYIIQNKVVSKTFNSHNLSLNIIKVIYFIAVILLALWIKTKLKIFFGRDWPLHWGRSHDGLIPEGVYQFNILQSKNWQGSFPSGHATFV